LSKNAIADRIIQYMFIIALYIHAVKG